MTQEERNPSELLNSAEELHKLILDNPTLPLLVFAGEDANTGDYNYMSCSSVQAYVGEFLDCQQTVDDERCFTDRDEFQEKLEDNLCDSFDGSEQEFEAYIEDILMGYEPYWKPCIILYVNN